MLREPSPAAKMPVLPHGGHILASGHSVCSCCCSSSPPDLKLSSAQSLRRQLSSSENASHSRTVGHPVHLASTLDSDSASSFTSLPEAKMTTKQSGTAFCPLSAGDGDEMGEKSGLQARSSIPSGEVTGSVRPLPRLAKGNNLSFAPPPAAAPWTVTQDAVGDPAAAAATAAMAVATISEAAATGIPPPDSLYAVEEDMKRSADQSYVDSRSPSTFCGGKSVWKSWLALTVSVSVTVPLVLFSLLEPFPVNVLDHDCLQQVQLKRGALGGDWRVEEPLSGSGECFARSDPSAEESVGTVTRSTRSRQERDSRNSASTATQESGTAGRWTEKRACDSVASPPAVAMQKEATEEVGKRSACERRTTHTRRATSTCGQTQEPTRPRRGEDLLCFIRGMRKSVQLQKEWLCPATRGINSLAQVWCTWVSRCRKKTWTVLHVLLPRRHVFTAAMETVRCKLCARQISFLLLHLTRGQCSVGRWQPVEGVVL